MDERSWTYSSAEQNATLTITTAFVHVRRCGIHYPHPTYTALPRAFTTRRALKLHCNGIYNSTIPGIRQHAAYTLPTHMSICLCVCYCLVLIRHGLCCFFSPWYSDITFHWHQSLPSITIWFRRLPQPPWHSGPYRFTAHYAFGRFSVLGDTPLFKHPPPPPSGPCSGNGLYVWTWNHSYRSFCMPYRCRLAKHHCRSHTPPHTTNHPYCHLAFTSPAYPFCAIPQFKQDIFMTPASNSPCWHALRLKGDCDELHCARAVSTPPRYAAHTLRGGAAPATHQLTLWAFGLYGTGVNGRR